MAVWYVTVSERGAGLYRVRFEMTDEGGTHWVCGTYVDGHSPELAHEESLLYLDGVIARMEGRDDG